MGVQKRLKKKLKKKGWNWYAFFLNIIWYFKHGIEEKAIIMLIVTVFSLGIGIIPIAIYCGIKGNEDRYTHNRYVSIGKWAV